jgi:hypothetical protein
MGWQRQQVLKSDWRWELARAVAQALVRVRQLVRPWRRCGDAVRRRERWLGWHRWREGRLLPLRQWWELEWVRQRVR